LIRRAVTILLFLALNVQTLPVRVCAVEQIVTGRSCHDAVPAVAGCERQTAAAEPALDGHAGPSQHHHSDCQCEKPKGELNRSGPVTVPIDFVPAASASFDPSLFCAERLFLPTAQPSPDNVSGALLLPLLN
jgi:hypothetical protein